MQRTLTIASLIMSFIVMGCMSVPSVVQSGSEPAPEPPVALPALLEVELEAMGGFSPWSRVRYAIEQVRGQPMLVHDREYPGDYDDGEPARRTLLGEGAWSRLHASLEACRLGALEGLAQEPAAGERPAWRWRVRWRDAALGASSERVVWLTDEMARDWPCLREIEAAVASELEPIRFERVFVAESERGTLDVRTVPVTEVWIDGVALERTTPLWDIVLPAGHHTIRMVNRDEGIDRTVEVVVERGVKTLLELELR